MSYFENIPVVELVTLLILILITIFRKKLSSNHEYRRETPLARLKKTEKPIAINVNDDNKDTYSLCLTKLSTEVLVHLLGYLNTTEIIQVLQVSKPLLNEVRSDLIWEQLWIQTYSIMWQNPLIKKVREARLIYWDPCQNFGPPQQGWFHFYIMFEGSIYDVTSFMHDHPGSLETLTEGAGCDATDAFEEIGHSTQANKLMKKLFLWDCNNSCKRCATPVSQLSSSNSNSNSSSSSAIQRKRNRSRSDIVQLRHIPNRQTRLHKQMKVNQAIIMRLANERNTRSFLTQLPSALTSGGSEAYRAIMYQTAQLGQSVTATATAAASSLSAASEGGLSMEDIMGGGRRQQSAEQGDRTTSRDSTEDFLTLITATRDDEAETSHKQNKHSDVDSAHLLKANDIFSGETNSKTEETHFTGAHKVVPSLDGYFDCSSALPFDPQQHGDNDQQGPFMGGIMPGQHHAPQQVEHAVNHNHHHPAAGGAPFNQFADDEDDREYLEHFGQPRVFFDPLTQDWTVWWTCCGKGEVLVEAVPSAASIAASEAAAIRAAVVVKQKEEEKKQSDLPGTTATTKSTSSLLNSSYFQKVAKKIGAQQEPIFLSLKNMYRRVKEISLGDA